MKKLYKRSHGQIWKKEMEQGFQGWEYKFNSVSSSRGDYPFITVTAGTRTSIYGKLATIKMLEVRKNGQGKEGHKKPVLFPKIVFLYDENLHGPGKPLEDVFEANDVGFISLNENFDTTTPYGKAMVGILSVFAQYERENIRERTQMGITERIKTGKWRGTKPPFGYDYNNGDDVLVPK